MSLLIPAPRFRAQERNYSGRPSLTWGANPIAHATPHTLGTKVEIIAATLYETTWIGVTIYGTTLAATDTAALVNIYTGAAGSEVILIPNLLAGWAPIVQQGARRYEFPLRIPRGTRLSCDMQALITVDTCSVRVELADVDGWCGAGVECLGADTAASKGAAVTPGGAAEGTFTAIGTSGRLYRYVFATLAGNSDTTLGNGVQGLDIGTGGALIAGLENFPVATNSLEYEVPTDEGRYVDVASGTALQARLQSDTTDTEAKTVCIWGVY